MIDTIAFAMFLLVIFLIFWEVPLWGIIAAIAALVAFLLWRKYYA